MIPGRAQFDGQHLDVEPPPTQELPFMMRFDLEEHETIVFATRQSPLTPLVMLWPIAIGFFGWAILDQVTEAVAGSLLPGVIQFGLLGLTTILAARWFVRDLLGYFLCWYVLTNKRLIVTRGVLRRLRHEAATARIQTVHVERMNPIANTLDIGDVKVLTASSTGAIYLYGVRRPEDVAYTIMLVQQGKVGAPKADGEAEAGADDALAAPAVRAALDTLLDDDESEPEENRNHLLHGTVLRRRIDLAMLPGEVVLDRLYRHWFTLLLRLLPPSGAAVILLLILALVRRYIGFAFGGVWTLMALIALGALIWDLLLVANYVDDVFILTNQRIIDIDREYFVFAETQKQTLYRSVQDVEIKLPLLGRYFSYGNIFVETAGRAPNIEMYNMAHPRRTQERIFALINADKERQAAVALKNAHKDLHASVGAVLAALMLATPDVRGLAAPQAVTRLRQAGLRVVIAGERASARQAPGVVLAQTPGPGATALRGAEVSLTLSRRPTRAGR